MKAWGLFLVLAGTVVLSGCSYGNYNRPRYDPISDFEIPDFFHSSSKPRGTNVVENPKNVPSNIQAKHNDSVEYVEVNHERRRLPYNDSGKWVYPNVEAGKPPVSTSYKLRLN